MIDRFQSNAKSHKHKQQQQTKHTDKKKITKFECQTRVGCLRTPVSANANAKRCMHRVK